MTLILDACDSGGGGGVQLTTTPPSPADPVASIVYIGESDYPSQITYNLAAGGTEVVDITYTVGNDPTIKGITYTGHAVDIYGATLVTGTKYIKTAARQAHAANELETIERLGLTVDDLLTDGSGYDVFITDSGELLYFPTIG